MRMANERETRIDLAHSPGGKLTVRKALTVLTADLERK